MTEAFQAPRTLVEYSSRDLPLRWGDVLIIGSGVAGMTAALEAAKQGTVILVTKSELKESNTSWAQGGIAVCLEETEEAFQSHIEDTLKAGGELCDPEIVSLVVREGTPAVRQLINWGCQFDVEDNGELALCKEGGHSEKRILHAQGDATGQEISRALIEQVRNHRNIKIMEHVFTVDLITHEGACHGALVWDDIQGKQVILARATILCSGGCGRVYRETTNPRVATGDGVAMAFRAGAEIQDIEFIQFHPTTLYVAGASRALISEALRGEGAYLRDRNGRRFMEGVHPDKELAPRDVVSQTITHVMRDLRDTNVFLDLTHIKTDVRKRFPGIQRLCQKYRLDLAKDQIPVRPSAHYMVGGVRTDIEGRTSIPQLFAAGEVACTKLHGANRLASNSLLEGLVFGFRAGRAAADLATKKIGAMAPMELGAEPFDRRPADLDIQDLKASLGAMMWRSVGIEREQQGLQNAVSQINFWSGYVLSTELAGPRGWQLQNQLTVAWLIATQALARQESRGTHLRTDFPEMDSEGKHSLIARGNGL